MKWRIISNTHSSLYRGRGFFIKVIDLSKELEIDTIFRFSDQLQKYKQPFISGSVDKSELNKIWTNPAEKNGCGQRNCKLKIFNCLQNINSLTFIKFLSLTVCHIRLYILMKWLSEACSNITCVLECNVNAGILSNLEDVCDSNEACSLVNTKMFSKLHNLLWEFVHILSIYDIFMSDNFLFSCEHQYPVLPYMYVYM